MKVIFASLIFLVACNSSGKIESVTSGKVKSNSLPLWISYGKNAPPDSISDFVKVYFKTKGYEVIDQKESRELIMGSMQTAAKSIYNSGNISDFDKQYQKKMEPVCRVLLMHIFSNDKSPEYSIDSIHWKTQILPSMDSIVSKYSFSLTGRNLSDGYSVLKLFADSLISVKILR